MSANHLSTYLNDHLAGSVAAIEMLQHGVGKHADAIDVDAVLGIKRDIEADRGTLEALMARLGISESKLRKAVAWLGERLTRMNLIVDDMGDHEAIHLSLAQRALRSSPA